MVKPIYSSDFTLVEEGWHLFRVEEVTFNETEKGLLAKVRSVVEQSAGGSSEGASIWDNFPLYTEFGLGRFLGFLVKTMGIPEKDYPLDYFDDGKKQKKVVSQLPGSLFGGRVKHRETSQGNIMANITEYISKDEFTEQFKGRVTEGRAEEGLEAEEESEEGW